MKEVLGEALSGNGVNVLTAKCGQCRRVELAMASENREKFLWSLYLAGWKWKKNTWSCVECEVGK